MIVKKGVEELEKAIREFIQTKLVPGENHELTATCNLIEGGIIDSLGIIKLIDFIDETYAIEVGEDDLTSENFETIELITKYISSHQKS